MNKTLPNFLPASPRSTRSGFTLVELLVVIAIIALLAAASIAGITSALKNARRAVCVSNLRSIGAAVTTYTGDNNLALPFTGNASDPSWDAALGPYLGNIPTTAANPVLKCPEDSRSLTATGAFARSYSFNGNLMGKRTIQVPAPSQTVMVAEWYSSGSGGSGPASNYQYGGSYAYVVYTPGACPSAPNSVGYHGATSNFLFVDGHVESLNPNLTVSSTPSMFQVTR